MSPVDPADAGSPGDVLRQEAALRTTSVGPLVGRASLLRRFLEVDQELRTVLADLPFDLEMLDTRLRLVFGQRWWEDVHEALLRRDLGDDDDRV